MNLNNFYNPLTIKKDSIPIHPKEIKGVPLLFCANMILLVAPSSRGINSTRGRQIGTAQTAPFSPHVNFDHDWGPQDPNPITRVAK